MPFSPLLSHSFFIQMDDINVLHHRCLLNLRRRIRDIGDGRPAQERYMRLQKDGDTLRSALQCTAVRCFCVILCWFLCRLTLFIFGVEKLVCAILGLLHIFFAEQDIRRKCFLLESFVWTMCFYSFKMLRTKFRTFLSFSMLLCINMLTTSYYRSIL